MLAVATLLVAGAVALFVVGGGDGVAPGVRVAGVELDVPAERARELVAARGRELAGQAVSVEQDGRLLTVMRPTDLGAAPRTRAAIEQARRASPGTFGQAWRRLTGGSDDEVPLALVYRPEALERWIADLARQVDRPAESARVVVDGTQLAVEPAREGRRLDRRALERLMTRDAAAIPATLELPVARLSPRTSTEQAEASAAAGREIIARPAIVRVDGRESGLDPGDVARALRFEGGGARLDPAAIRGPVSRAFAELETPPRSARFLIRGSRVQLQPSRDGRLVDVQAVARGLEGEDRPVDADVVTAGPTLTTEEARALRITSRVGEFTTPYSPGEPRVTNIRRAAEILDGTVIPAGATFSLNRALGRRTTERGFVAAPMIANGLLVDAVGGGVSQIATTVFNAAFFSGLQIVTHTPHQLYISRYPVGREATISWPSPDLVVRNDWDAGVLVRARAGADSVTVSMYSAPLGRRVESTTGSPYDFTDAETRLVVNPALAPGEQVDVQPGGQGFSVDVTRKVYAGSRLKRDETFSTTYYADPEIIAVGPGTPGAEELPGSEG